VVVVVLVGASAALGTFLVAPNSTSGTTMTSKTTLGTTSHYTPDGILSAQVTIGPVQPVCFAGNAGGVPPHDFSGIDAVVTSSSGNSVTLAVSWAYVGCKETGSVPKQPGSGELYIQSRVAPTLVAPGPSRSAS
jgi:hypothetical protein